MADDDVVKHVAQASVIDSSMSLRTKRRPDTTALFSQPHPESVDDYISLDDPSPLCQTPSEAPATLAKPVVSKEAVDVDVDVTKPGRSGPSGNEMDLGSVVQQAVAQAARDQPEQDGQDTDESPDTASHSDATSQGGGEAPKPAGSKKRRALTRDRHGSKLVRHALDTWTQATFFASILTSKSGEAEVYERISALWVLMAVTGSFLTVICHVGFTEFPSADQRTVSAWWYDGYAICMSLGLVCNMTAVFLSAFLLLYLAHVPRSSVKYSLRKILHWIVGPTYWVAAGLVSLLAGCIFLARITFAGTLSTLYISGAGLGISLTILLVGAVAFLRSTNSKPETDAPASDKRASFALKPILRTLMSGITDAELFKRLTQLWTTVSLVAAVCGGICFEGFWLRPLDTAGGETADRFTAVSSAACYLGLALSAVAVLLAALLIIVTYFCGGASGIVQVVTRVQSLIFLPVAIFICAWTALAVGAWAFVLAIYTGNPDVLLACVVALGAMVVGMFLYACLATPSARATEGNATGSGCLKTMRRIREALDMSAYSQTLLASTLPEDTIYDRISHLWAHCALLAALLATVCFLAVETVGEYPTNFESQGTFVPVAVFAFACHMLAIVSSFVLLLTMVTVSKGQLRPWLQKRVHAIFFPAILIAVGVFTMLVFVPILTRTLYNETAFVVSVACAGLLGIIMVVGRFKVLSAMPDRQNEDEELEIQAFHSAKSARTVMEWLTRSDLWAVLLDTSMDQHELFTRLGTMLEGTGLVAALLAFLSIDALREVPSRADPLGPETTLYSVAATVALALNMLTLFLTSFMAMAVSLVPGGSLKRFIHQIRHLLFTPVLGLLFGACATILNWMALAEIQYQDSPTSIWIVRAIAATATIAMVVLHGTVCSTTADTKRFREGQKNSVDFEQSTAKPSRVYLTITFWPRKLAFSDLPGKQLYQRVEGMWSTLGLVGAVMCSVSFLGFQQGLQASSIGRETPENLSSFYVATMFFALCTNLLGTYLSTLFMAVLSVVPRSRTMSLLRALLVSSIAPNACLFLGCMSFLLGFPILARSLYSPVVFAWSGTIAWLLLLASVVATAVLQVFGERFSRAFHRTPDDGEAGDLEAEADEEGGAE